MRRAFEFAKRTAALALVVTGCGCVTGGKPAKVAGVPAAPQPQQPVTVPPRPSSPEPPISYPQTVVSLPRMRPVPPESIGEPPTEEPTPVRTPRSKPASPGAKELPASGELRAPEPSKPGPPPAETAPAPALMRTDQNARTAQQIETRIRTVRDTLQRLGDQTRSPNVDASLSRIRSLLNLADRALKRRDLGQADSLTDRAEVIARDLLRAP